MISNLIRIGKSYLALSVLRESLELLEIEESFG
jgi:hypothetical protein